MSDYFSLPTNFNGDSGYPSLMNYQLDLSDFEISDFLIPEASSGEDSTSTQFDCGTSSNPVLVEQIEESVVYNGGNGVRRTTCNMNRQSKAVGKKTKADAGFRVAFRTKSELDIMDDGYKWRKYGKKSVKNSPNPRNYYRCSHQGCHVKKRVERDREDGNYVITTYDGVHSHESPSIIYYNEMPLMVPNGWTLQASQ